MVRPQSIWTGIDLNIYAIWGRFPPPFRPRPPKTKLLRVCLRSHMRLWIWFNGTLLCLSPRRWTHLRTKRRELQHGLQPQSGSTPTGRISTTGSEFPSDSSCNVDLLHTVASQPTMLPPPCFTDGMRFSSWNVVFSWSFTPKGFILVSSSHKSFSIAFSLPLNILLHWCP